MNIGKTVVMKGLFMFSSVLSKDGPFLFDQKYFRSNVFHVFFFFSIRNLPEQDANPLLASFKTRPTNMKRVEEEAQEKVKAGRPGFHCSAIAFHCKEEDHTKLHTLMTNVQNKTANHKKEIFYLLAENHNVMSHKRAAERLKAVDSVKAKNFETFECYVLSYPTRERDEREDDYNARLKKIFKTVCYVVLFSS